MKRSYSNAGISTRRTKVSYKRPRVAKTPEARALQQAKNELYLSRRRNTTELKAVQYEALGQSITNSGTIFNLQTTLTRGTSGLNNFLGNEILPTSLRLNINCAASPTISLPADIFNFIRFIIFQWDDNNSPTVGNILATSNVTSQYLWSSRPHLRILSDQKVAFQQPDPALSSDTEYLYVYVKGKKMEPISFPSATLIPQKGGLWMLAISDSAVTPAPVLSFSSQITFTDI